MNSENLHTFFERAKTDSLLQERIRSLGEVPSPEALARLSEDIGLPFTASDLEAHAQRSGAIPDDQLEEVSGGFPITLYVNGQKVTFNR